MFFLQALPAPLAEEARQLRARLAARHPASMFGLVNMNWGGADEGQGLFDDGEDGDGQPHRYELFRNGVCLT